MLCFTWHFLSFFTICSCLPVCHLLISLWFTKSIGKYLVLLDSDKPGFVACLFVAFLLHEQKLEENTVYYTMYSIQYTIHYCYTWLCYVIYMLLTQYSLSSTVFQRHTMTSWLILYHHFLSELLFWVEGAFTWIFPVRKLFDYFDTVLSSCVPNNIFPNDTFYFSLQFSRFRLWRM